MTGRRHAVSSLRRSARGGRALALLELVEDVIYVAIALFLIGSGVLLLIGAGIDIAGTSTSTTSTRWS